MKVTGFSFIRNGVKFDFPIVDWSNQFCLFVTNLSWLLEIRGWYFGINPEHSLEDKNHRNRLGWSLRQGGRVLADETNKAYQAISEDSDWCFYIQGDEVMHEAKICLRYKPRWNTRMIPVSKVLFSTIWIFMGLTIILRIRDIGTSVKCAWLEKLKTYHHTKTPWVFAVMEKNWIVNMCLRRFIIMVG